MARSRAEVVGLLLPAAALRRKQLPFATLHLWQWALSAQFRHGSPSGPRQKRHNQPLLMPVPLLF